MPLKDRKARRLYGKTYREKNKVRLREQYRAWRLSSKEHLNQYRRRKYHSKPSTERDYQLRRRYEITLAEYNGLLAKQCGRCAVCKEPVV